MYSIYADNLLIYSGVFLENKNYKLTSAKLTLSDNSSGQFSFVIPKSNVGYNAIVPMDTTITIKKDNKIFWDGRVISGNIDFKKNKHFICEGPLAFLNDTIQPPKDYSTKSIESYLSSILQKHNSRVEANRRVQLGTVTVVDSAFVMSNIITNYSTSYEAINTLVNSLGGHLVIRYDQNNGSRYLDYLDDYPGITTQTIEFGSNLLDLAQDFDETEYCTVVIPLGASSGEDPDTRMETFVNVESVNHGSMYIEATEAVTEHGRIEKVINFDNIEDPTLLYALGVMYLTDTQFNDLVLDVSALDLNLIDNSIEDINLLDKIQVISKPHGINKVFPVVKVSLDLLSPENNTYTLGSEYKNDTLSQQNNAANAELAEKMNQLKATNALEFYRFENEHEFVVSRRTRLCNIRFATKSAGLVSWQSEILAQVTADEGYKAKVKFYYYLNNALIEYYPTETLDTGEHIFSLYFPLEIETLTSYQWRVEVEVEHGQIVIPIGNMRGVIWGDKLVAQVGWNGYIDIDETINTISLDDIQVRTLTASTSMNTYVPLEGDADDTFSGIALDDISIVEFIDYVLINKTSIYLEGMKWRDVYDSTWGAIYDEHTW